MFESFTKLRLEPANNCEQSKHTAGTREDEVDSPTTGKPDYKAYLKKLEDASEGGFDDLFDKANQLRPEIPPLIMRKKGSFDSDIDEMSRKLIPTGKLNGEHIALRTKGDGNCLFRAASILAFGDESKHLEMRVRTLLELACNKLRYLNDTNNKQRIHAEERYILRKSSRKRRDECSEELDTLNLEVYFKQVVRETCKESNSAVVWHLLALPTVFWRSVKIVFPEVTEDIRELQECFKDAIDPCGGHSMLDPLVIMWTSIKPLEEMKLNHFVPLVPAGEVHSLGKAPLPPQNIGEKEERDKKPVQCSSSDSHLSQMDSKDKYLKLGDPMGESLLNNLELLERLASYLDVENPYGNPKCWKHLAQHFGVEASRYETFICSPRSPTEKLFAFVISRDADTFTIEMLKSGLRDIDREDIITDILVENQGPDSKFTDATPVERLSQKWPSVFDDITRLLDTDKSGVNNWKQLAGKLNVPKTEHQNFEESDDPAMKLLEYFMATDRNPTVGRLRGELEDLGMTKASQIISNSEEVTDNNLLEEFFDKDLDAVMELCSVLNQRHSRLKRRWRRLGNKLGIKKIVLDTFSPHEREISSTHALINYLGASKAFLTMQDLILALDSIGRHDTLNVVTNYFPG